MPGSLFRGSLQLSDFMIFILFEGWLRGGDLNPGPLGYEGNSTRDQHQLTPTKPNQIAASSASV